MKKFLLFAFSVLLAQVLISCAAPVRKDTEAKIDESKTWGADSKRLFELILDRGVEPNNLIYQSCLYARQNLFTQVADGSIEPLNAMCAFDKAHRIFYVSYFEGLFIRDYKIVDIPLRAIVDYSSFQTEGDSVQRLLNLKRFKGQFQIRTRDEVSIFLNFDSFAEMDAELVSLGVPKIPPGQVYWWDVNRNYHGDYGIQFPAMK